MFVCFLSLLTAAKNKDVIYPELGCNLIRNSISCKTNPKSCLENMQIFGSGKVVRGCPHPLWGLVFKIRIFFGYDFC